MSTPTMESLFPQIGRIMHRVQDGTANHQTNTVKLFGIHSAAFEHNVRSTRRDGWKMLGLRAFQEAFSHHLTRILQFKRTETAGHNAVKFLGVYTNYVNLPDTSNENEPADGPGKPRDYFNGFLINFLVAGAGAKDETIRYRAIQILSEVASFLGDCDPEDYSELRKCLMSRMKDKKPFIRVQAVSAFSRLTSGEKEVPEGQPSPLEVLGDVIKHDTSHEVRREAIIGLPRILKSIPLVIRHTRDDNAGVRKAVYAAVLEPNTFSKDGPGPFYPGRLQLSDRDAIVLNGLRDRDQTVQKAALKLMQKWLDALSHGVKTESPLDKIIPFLGLFDVGGQPVELALKCIFETRHDMFAGLTFNDEFWSSLRQDRSPEKALLARIFVEYCAEKKGTESLRLESNTPDLIRLAEIIQEAWAELRIDIYNSLSEPRGDLQDRIKESTFILGEMLKVAFQLDFTDETGRRAMCSTLRNMLSDPFLPEYLIDPCCEAFKEATRDESSLLRIIMEVTAKLAMTKEEEQEVLLEGEPSQPLDYFERRNRWRSSGAQDSPQQREQGEATDLQSIKIANGILRTVNGEMDKHPMIKEIMSQFAAPAIRSQSRDLQLQGYLCMGFCCYISPTLAALKLNDFNHTACSRKLPPELHTPVLQSYFDILHIHGATLLKTGDNERLITDSLVRLLGDEDPIIRATVAQGLAKLAIVGHLKQNEVLTRLLLSCHSPENKDNQMLRQFVSAFFFTFACASSRNQRRLRDIFIDAFRSMCKLREKLEDEEEIDSTQFLMQFVEWTKPENVIQLNGAKDDAQVDDTVQLDLATDILKELFREDLSKEDKKALCQMLHTLETPVDIDDLRLRKHWILMENLPLRRPLPDTKLKDLFAKYASNINARFQEKLQLLTDEELRKCEELHEIFAFVDDIVEDPDGAVDGIDSTRGVRKRERSDSIISDDETDIEQVSARKGKRRRTDDDSFIVKQENSDDARRAPPPRKQPNRTTAPKKLYEEPIVISSDSEDEPPASVVKKPAPRPVQRKVRSPPAPPPPPSDDEPSEIPYDSIMDDSDAEIKELLLDSDDE